MSSIDDYSIIQLLNNITIIIHKYIGPLLYILGNLGNFLSLLVFLKRSWRKHVCVFYFTVYILLNSCFINSTMLSSIFIQGFNITAQNSNVILCKIFIYVAFLFSMSSPSVLIAASIDRLLISSQNVETRLYSSKRLAYFSTSIIIFFWIIFNVHLLVKVDIQQFESSYIYCYYDLSKWYLDFVFYSVISIHLLFALTMLILSVLSAKNVRHIRTVPRQQRNRIRVMTKKDFQLLQCLFVQDIVFLTFAMLLDIIYVYEAVTKDQAQTLLQQAIGNFLDILFSFLYNIPHCANFFIFISVSKAFRQELKRLVYRMYGKNLMPIREEENKQGNIELNVV